MDAYESSSNISQMKPQGQTDEGDVSSSKSSVVTPRSDNERDEIEEVHKFSQKDTTRIRFWRFVIVAVLLATACTVTLTTRNLLQKEQEKSIDCYMTPL